MTIIWCIVPEISSATDRIFVILDHFLPFYLANNKKNQNFEKLKKNSWRYYHFTYAYHKWQLYNIWLLRYGAWQTEFFVIVDYFLPFCLHKNLKNEEFEKNEKTPGNIIIWHKCTKNQDHMLHCSWDTTCDVCNSYFLFCAIFCPFTPLTPKKSKFWEN